jgi:hypothetical protein
VRLRDEIYSSNFEVADLYEAWALWCFGKVCVRYVKLQISKGAAPATQLELFKPLKRITLLGIQAFVFVYVMKSCYLLSLAVLRSYPFELHVCDVNGKPGAIGCGWDRFFSGAGFTASSIAIYNIFTFEHNLEPFLDGFRPRLKFLGVKLLVSLAFIQDVALQTATDLFLPLSKEQRQLLYASLICVEVFLIACMQVPAWNAKDAWFREDKLLPGHSDCEDEVESGQDIEDRQDSLQDFRTWQTQRCGGRDAALSASGAASASRGDAARAPTSSGHKGHPTLELRAYPLGTGCLDASPMTPLV